MMPILLRMMRGWTTAPAGDDAPAAEDDPFADDGDDPFGDIFE